MHFFIKVIPTELRPTQGQEYAGTRELATNQSRKKRFPGVGRPHREQRPFLRRHAVHEEHGVPWNTHKMEVFLFFSASRGGPTPVPGDTKRGMRSKPTGGQDGNSVFGRNHSSYKRNVTRRQPTAHNTFSLSFCFCRDLICIPRPQRDRFTRGAIPHRLTFQGRLRFLTVASLSELSPPFFCPPSASDSKFRYRFCPPVKDSLRRA